MKMPFSVEDAIHDPNYAETYSSVNEWGITRKEFCDLMLVYLVFHEVRKVIEDILTECNFHSECECFRSGNYIEALEIYDR